MPQKAVRQQIASAIGAVIQVARLSDGRRRVVGLQEITGMEGDVVTMQDVFGYQQTGVAASGAVEGSFIVAGIYPRFCERLRAKGITMPASLFGALPEALS